MTDHIAWNAPSAANAALSPLFGTTGFVDFVLVKRDPTNPQSVNVLGAETVYAQARYSVDSPGTDVFLTAKRTPRPLFGVLGCWALAQ